MVLSLLLLVNYKKKYLITLIKIKKKIHVLITGGNGIVGKYLTSNLTDAGYFVSTVSRSNVKKSNHFIADLTNLNSVIELATKLQPVHHIIHCAAIAHGEKPPPSYTIDSFNSLISQNLINAFDMQNVHWIFMSSISVYGNYHSHSFVPITINPNPADKYGKGKLSDESLFLSKCKNLDILRLCPVYGNNHVKDIKKRVFIPGTRIKIKIYPSPLYTLCKLEDVLNFVQNSLAQCNGKRISQVGENYAIYQSNLLERFPGKVFPVPQFIFKLTFIILSKIYFLKHIALMVKKLGMNNIYEVGIREL